MKNPISIFFIILFISCGVSNENSYQQSIIVDANAFAKIIKYSDGDPFIETIKKSEFFKVSGLEDKVIETTNGLIISIPKGAFIDKDGNIVEKEILVEITDIESFEEQFNANITSPSGQNILLNGGALYLNATKNGVQLGLNENTPIYIETKQESNPDLLVFEGIRNDKGEMQWINPKQPKKYLTPVSLEELDFLPKGFANEVDKNMPFGNYKTTTKELIDSLYYSLTANNTETLDIEKDCPRIFSTDDLEIEESYESTNLYSSNYDTGEFAYINLTDSTSATYCDAINPASIKVIKSEKFAQTFISTKQFENRLQIIHDTKNQKVLEIYTNNLTKNMSYCDSLAAKLFEIGSPFELKFKAFAKENWSNLEKLPSSVQKLGKYYSVNLKKVENELVSLKNDYHEALNKKSAKANEIKEEYKSLLTKRQNYRMKKHGFVLNHMGWVATGIIIEIFTIDIVVKDGADFDRVHVYTIDPSIKSIFSWQSIDKINFNYAFSEDALLVYKKSLQAKAMVVAYVGDEPHCDIQDFRVKNEIEVNFALRPTTKIELSKMIKRFDIGSKDFNKIKVDLEYQSLFYDEKQRLKKELNKRKVIANLLRYVYFIKPIVE